MLILPFQHTLSWRKPPVLTLSLIILNCLIYISYQLQDHERIQEIISHYQATVLPHAEAPHYIDYIERNPSIFPEEYVQEIKQALAEDGPKAIAADMALNLEFVAFLDYYKDTVWEEPDSEWWQSARAEFYQNEIKKLSNYAYGFIPAEFEVYSLFSYQFLHGSWGHLFGNMLILFILGFGLERVLNQIKLLILYLLTGAFSAITFSMVEQGSMVTLVCAAGSISGLMGIFVGVYGFQKIRFFYFVGVAFGYFRFPALIILPIWVANELIQYSINLNGQVAYFAHIGGLVSGGALAFLFRQTWLKPTEDSLAIKEESEANFKHDYQSALTLIENLKFEQARKRFIKLWQGYPNKPFLLDHLYHLYKMDDSSKGFLQTMTLLIQHHRDALSVEQWQHLSEFVRKVENLKKINHKQLTLIINQALKDKQYGFIEALLETQEASYFKEHLGLMYQGLIDYAKESVQPMKAQHYQALLAQYGHSTN